MIEYLEDLIEERPYEEFPRDVQKSGMFVYRTGDVLVDKWQAKSALGEKIDFTEAFTTDATKAAFEAIKEKSRQKFKARNVHLVEVKEAVAEAPDEIRDDYTGG